LMGYFRIDVHTRSWNIPWETAQGVIWQRLLPNVMCY